MTASSHDSCTVHFVYSPQGNSFRHTLATDHHTVLIWCVDQVHMLYHRKTRLTSDPSDHLLELKQIKERSGILSRTLSWFWEILPLLKCTNSCVSVQKWSIIGTSNFKNPTRLADPGLWNNPQQDTRTSKSLPRVKIKLKTHLSWLLTIHN